MKQWVVLSLLGWFAGSGLDLQHSEAGAVVVRDPETGEPRARIQRPADAALLSDGDGVVVADSEACASQAV